MSLGDRLGIASLIIGLLGIALLYLAPEQRIFGWIAVAALSLCLIGWFSLEAKHPIGARLCLQRSV